MADDGLAVRALALCAGLGVTERAVNRVIPTRLVCAVERAAYCAATLVARMEEEAVARAPIWSDLSTFDGRPWLDHVDLVVSGIPCQGASVAGKRAGTGDERWLWPHVARIIDECRSPMLLLENVPGLLSVNRGGRSRKSSTSWPRAGGLHAGTAFPLEPSVPRTSEIVSSCSLPTPTASTYGSSQNGINGKGGEFERPSAGTASLFTMARTGALDELVRSMQPNVADHSGSDGPVSSGDRRLDPRMLEWMMGMPEGHSEIPMRMIRNATGPTESTPSATVSSKKPLR